VAFVNQGLTRLEAASIKREFTDGKGEEFPAWSQDLVAAANLAACGQSTNSSGTCPAGNAETSPP